MFGKGRGIDLLLSPDESMPANGRGAFTVIVGRVHFSKRKGCEFIVVKHRRHRTRPLGQQTSPCSANGSGVDLPLSSDESISANEQDANLPLSNLEASDESMPANERVQIYRCQTLKVTDKSIQANKRGVDLPLSD